MTDGQTGAVVAAIADALGHGELTIEELDGEVVRRVGPWAGDLVIPAFDGWWPRWRQAIGTAAYRGVLCFGPPRGRKVTYADPRRWVPGFETETPGGDLAGLVLRYLSAYGPATPTEFARWLGVPPGPVKAVTATMTADLAEVDVEGVVAYLPARDQDLPDEPVRGVRLLPYFDPYTVGCHPRDRLFPGDAARRALSGGQAGTRPVLLVDGTVGGIWHSRRTARRVEITVEPFATLTAGQQRELDREVERIGEILDLPATGTIGTVTARSHL